MSDQKVKTGLLDRSGNEIFENEVILVGTTCCGKWHQERVVGRPGKKFLRVFKTVKWYLEHPERPGEEGLYPMVATELRQKLSDI